MLNQFYYTRTISMPPEEGETEVKTINLLDSFNLSLVQKSYDLGDGRRRVLLHDMHERWKDVEITNTKGRIINMKREKDVYQSEFTLSGDDVERFVKTTQIL